jgi:hypothetical protein
VVEHHFKVVKGELVCISCNAQVQVPSGLSEEAAMVAHRLQAC